MYKVIGADGRQYGPVSLEQLRQWIAEGRVDAQTLIQPDGGTEWKAAANYPEIMAPAAPPVLPLPIPPRHPEADKKIAAGLCGVLLGGLGIHKFILGYSGAGATMLLISILTCGIGYPVMHIVGIIEGIIYLTKSDNEFVATYVTGQKSWF